MKLFAVIEEPFPDDAAILRYASGVSSVTEPPATAGQYTVTFNQSVSNCVVQAVSGLGDPAGSSTTLNTSIPTIQMDVGNASEVELTWLRPDNDVDFGVGIDTSFMITAFC
jgi:hypothetical protein